jgi:DNA-binding CsgD family transcriptional regulator
MDALPNSAESQLADSLRKLGSPGFENSLWHLFRRVAAPDNLLVLAYRDACPPQVLYSQSTQAGVFAQLQATYLAGAYQLDPFYDMHTSRVLAGSYRLRDVAPDAFQRSRYFIEYYEQTTLIDEVTFVAYPTDGVSLNLCIGRDTSSAQAFLPREVEACHRIAPIICALAEAHWAGLVNTSGPADDLSAALARTIKSAHNIHLSPRQAAVAVLILRGHSTASIALRLGISAQTVKVFRKQLYGRCHLSSQAELFALMLPLLKKAV